MTPEDEDRVRELIREEKPLDPASQRVVSWGCFIAVVIFGIGMAIRVALMPY